MERELEHAGASAGVGGQTIVGLQDTVEDLVDHQISTVSVFCSQFAGRSHSCELCVGSCLYRPHSDPDCRRQAACIFTRTSHWRTSQ